MSRGRQHAINRVRGEVTRAAISATSEDEIRRRICERFAASESYSSAWIGRYEAENETVVPMASAGIAEETPAGITITEESPRGELATEAVRTREVAVKQNFVEEPPCEERRDHALGFF